MLKDRLFALFVSVSIVLLVLTFILLVRLPVVVRRGPYEVFDPDFHFPQSVILSMLGIIVCQGLAIWRAIIRR